MKDDNIFKVRGAVLEGDHASMVLAVPESDTRKYLLGDDDEQADILLNWMTHFLPGTTLQAVKKRFIESSRLAVEIPHFIIFRGNGTAITCKSTNYEKITTTVIDYGSSNSHHPCNECGNVKDGGNVSRNSTVVCSEACERKVFGDSLIEWGL